MQGSGLSTVLTPDPRKREKEGERSPRDEKEKIVCSEKERKECLRKQEKRGERGRAGRLSGTRWKEESWRLGE